jgi:hypothetical protein
VLAVLWPNVGGTLQVCFAVLKTKFDLILILGAPSSDLELRTRGHILAPRISFIEPIRIPV